MRNRNSPAGDRLGCAGNISFWDSLAGPRRPPYLDVLLPRPGHTFQSLTTETAVLNPASDPSFVVRLIESNAGQLGRAIITRPAGVPQHNFKFFYASFSALMYNGNGADGFSFNYGPNENSYINGAYEDGTTSGLAISFDCRRDVGRYPDQCNISYNGVLLRSYGLDLWDGGFANQNLFFQIAYGPNGLDVIVQTRRFLNGELLVNDLVASNLAIPNWRPLSTWKFFFAGRTGASTMRVAVTDLVMSTDSEPPSIGGVPSVVNGTEDTPSSFGFSVFDNEDVTFIDWTTSSSNPALLSSIVVVNDGPDAGCYLSPAPNANGSCVVTITATQDGDSVSASFTYNIAPVNDAPAIAVASPQSTPEDTPLDVAVTLTDPDTSLASLTLAATSSDPSVIPDGEYFYQRFGRHADGAVGAFAGCQWERCDHTVMLRRRGQFDAHLHRECDGGQRPARRQFGNGHAASGQQRYLDQRARLGSWRRAILDTRSKAGSAWMVRHPGPRVRSGTLLGAYGNAAQFSAGTYALGSHYWRFVFNTATTATVRFGSGNIWESPTMVALPIGLWNHLAATWDGTNYAIYLNGIAQGVTPYPAGNLFNLQGVSLTLGGRAVSGVSVFPSAPLKL